jgi:hypothetical protein
MIVFTTSLNSSRFFGECKSSAYHHAIPSLGEFQKLPQHSEVLVAPTRMAPSPMNATPLIKSSAMRGVATAFSRLIVSGYLDELALSDGDERKNLLRDASFAPLTMLWRSLD